MGLKSRIRRHRKDYLLIAGVMVVLLVIFSGIFYLLLRRQGIPQELITNKVLLFVLFYVNLILILAILFVLLRNIFKLILERRSGILGSKLKTKLVFANIGLSLIPVLLLFITAFGILQDSIDRWFDTPQRQMLEYGRNLAQALRDEVDREVLGDAGLALDALADVRVGDPAQSPALGREVGELLARLDLDLLGVYEGTEFVYEAIDPRAGVSEPLRLDRSFLAEAASEGEATSSLSLDRFGGEGLLVLAARARVPETGDDADREGGTAEASAAGEGSEGRKAPPRTVVVAGSRLGPELVTPMTRLILDYQTDRQLEVQQDEIKASHLLFFAMVTLVILLTSSWLGLVVARQVTVPIQALAEGTRRISQGDLSHRVEMPAEDELGVLVSSFNRMTEELAQNRRVIEASHLELMAANERLGEERALIAAVLENVAAGVISIDTDGRILTCNGAALEMLDQTEEEVRHRPIHEAWNDPERAKLLPFVEDRDGVAGDDGAGPEGDEVHLALGGQWRTLAVHVTDMTDAAGQRTGRVVLLEDLTDLTNAQRLAAWTEAARRIAHEIKNPLTPIRLSAQRLLRKHREGQELGPAIEDAVGIIDREVATMQTMVDEFSRYARMPGPRPEPVDLHRLLDETLHLYEQIKPGVEVKGEVDRAARDARLDPEQIKRALINLLDNALEATDAPGCVTVAAHRRNGYLEIQVADTGRGIPAKAKEKLFLPHFSTKGRGTGLGLAIVHRIVTEHHGSIRVEDNRPKGTVFTIELPG
jgi:two-component system nitrogen regulation sensor histidine kinase NtrY